MIDDILNEREATHGDFSAHAAASQGLKKEMWKHSASDVLTNVQWEALEMIQHKIARILAGDANHRDHWDDIAGYATLVARKMTDKESGVIDVGQEYVTEDAERMFQELG